MVFLAITNYDLIIIEVYSNCIRYPFRYKNLQIESVLVANIQEIFLNRLVITLQKDYTAFVKSLIRFLDVRDIERCLTGQLNTPFEMRLDVRFVALKFNENWIPMEGSLPLDDVVIRAVRIQAF